MRVALDRLERRGARSDRSGSDRAVQLRNVEFGGQWGANYRCMGLRSEVRAGSQDQNICFGMAIRAIASVQCRRAMEVQLQVCRLCDRRSRVHMAASVIRNPEPEPAAGARVCCTCTCTRTCTCCSPVPGPGGTSHVERSAGTIVMGSARLRLRTGTSSTRHALPSADQLRSTAQHSTAQHSRAHHHTHHRHCWPPRSPTQPRAALHPPHGRRATAVQPNPRSNACQRGP